MAQHECETFDFPIKDGNFDKQFWKNFGGGAALQAVKDAIKEAKELMEQAGNHAMRFETCLDPCERAIYVEPSIDSITLSEKDAWQHSGTYHRNMESRNPVFQETSSVEKRNQQTPSTHFEEKVNGAKNS